jgi:hypothetical protein
MDAEKIAPVQGYTSGIPWSIHLEAYDAYCKKWSPQPALIDLEGRNCRGGFSVGELDEFVPGWRDRASEIGRLRAEVERLRALTGAQPAPAAPSGVLKVAVDLLREVVGPLEVSAAVIEDEDGGEAIETLIGNVTRFVEQFDRAAPAAPSVPETLTCTCNTYPHTAWCYPLASALHLGAPAAQPRRQH